VKELKVGDPRKGKKRGGRGDCRMNFIFDSIGSMKPVPLAPRSAGGDKRGREGEERKERVRVSVV